MIVDHKLEQYYQALIRSNAAVTIANVLKIMTESRIELITMDLVSSNRVAAYTLLIAGTIAARKTYEFQFDGSTFDKLTSFPVGLIPNRRLVVRLSGQPAAYTLLDHHMRP